MRTAKTVKRPPQQPAQPQYANYWTPLTRNGTPCYIQHSPSTPTTGLRKRGNNTSRSTGRSGRQKAATRRNMQTEERVTVQGPVKKQQPDGMSHRGALAKEYPQTAAFLPVSPLPGGNHPTAQSRTQTGTVARGRVYCTAKEAGEATCRQMSGLFRALNRPTLTKMPSMNQQPLRFAEGSSLFPTDQSAACTGNPHAGPDPLLWSTCI